MMDYAAYEAKTLSDKLDILTDILEMGSPDHFAWCETVQRNRQRQVVSAAYRTWDSKETLTVNVEVMMRGIKVLFENNLIHKDIMESIQNDDIDQEAGDCIIQAGLFGELRYS